MMNSAVTFLILKLYEVLTVKFLGLPQRDTTVQNLFTNLR